MSCKYETVFFYMMVSNWCFVLQNKVIKECCTPYLCGLLIFDFIPDFASSVSNTQDLGTKNCVCPLFQFHSWFCSSHSYDKIWDMKYRLLVPNFAPGLHMGYCAGHKSRRLTLYASLVCAHYLFSKSSSMQPITLNLIIVALIPLGFGVTWFFSGEAKPRVPTTSFSFSKKILCQLEATIGGSSVIHLDIFT